MSVPLAAGGGNIAATVSRPAGLLGRFALGLVASFRNRMTSIACCSEPRVHRHAHLCHRFLRRGAEGGAGLEVRNIGNPGAVFLGPEYDDGVAVHAGITASLDRISWLDVPSHRLSGTRRRSSPSP